VFINYDVWNISDRTYDSTAFGYYIDPGIGGTNSGNDDARFDEEHTVAYAWDHVGKGDPAFGQWTPGYFGVTVIGSPGIPDPIGISSLSMTPLSDKGPNGVWPKNNEVVWRKMTGGFVDTGITNSNISIVIGSGPFALPKWTKSSYTAALLLGSDLQDIIEKKHIAQWTYNHGFTVPESLSQISSLGLMLSSPSPGSSISGIVPVQWTIKENPGNSKTTIRYSANEIDWFFLATVSDNSNSYQWDTRTLPDGIFYKLRLMTISPNGIGFAESTNFFTINNPGNAKPQVMLLGIADKISLKGIYQIRWLAGDADGDPCSVNLYYKMQYESQWSLIAQGIPATDGKYDWVTTKIPNSSAYDYQVKCEVVSPADTADAVLQNISILNPAVYQSTDTRILYKNSVGTGKIDIVVSDSAQTTGHSYELIFRNSVGSANICCDVLDSKTGALKLNGETQFDGFHETKNFDGLRLRIKSDVVALDTLGTGWTQGTASLKMVTKQDNMSYSLDKIFPYDYKLAFYNSVADTSVLNPDDPNNYPAIPTNFAVTNTTKNIRAEYFINDKNGDGLMDSGDEIIITENFVDISNFRLTWRIMYGDGSAGVTYPKNGDVYSIITKKPFAAGDTIVFATDGLTSVAPTNQAIPAGYELWQNYPNPFNPTTTLAFDLPEPSQVMLTVYDYIGREVATVVNGYRSAGRFEVIFDASKLGSGVYFYKLQAGSYTAVKKMLLLK